MSEQDKKIEAFKADMQDKGMYIDLYNESLIEAAWQAATAEANKRIAELESEVAELNNWKTCAIEVENEWDAQAVGKALNIQLGHSIRAGILPKITALQAGNRTLREALEKVIISGEMQLDDDKSQSYVEVSKDYIRKGRKALSATPKE